jgi:hypothetical protein
MFHQYARREANDWGGLVGRDLGICGRSRPQCWSVPSGQGVAHKSVDLALAGSMADANITQDVGVEPVERAHRLAAPDGRLPFSNQCHL